MTYADAVAYIESLNLYGWRLGNARMEAFLERLGNPQAQMPIVHITGTNGKGSTTALITSILRQAGYRVGSYFSPYVFDFCERIQIDGEPISHALLTEGVAVCKSLIERLRDTEYGQVTEFELKTALAFWAFVNEGVDIAVMEVGLGGRIDATNVIVPEVSVIVSIGLDHTDRLGPTHRDIAYEKAGIIKPGRPVVSGALHPDADAMIAQVAEHRGAPLIRVRPIDLPPPTPISANDPACHSERSEESQQALTLPNPPSADASGEGGSPTPLSHSVGEGSGVRAEVGEGQGARAEISEMRQEGESTSPLPTAHCPLPFLLPTPHSPLPLLLPNTLLYQPLPSPRDSALKVCAGDWNLELHPSLLGDYQRHNTACAVGAILCLRERGYPIPDEAIAQGVASVKMPGRLQVVRERPLVVLDGAHNPDASQALAKTLPNLFSFRQLLVVFGMLRPHEPAPVLEPLLPLTSELILTQIPNMRAYDPETLLGVARQLRPDLPTLTCHEPHLAFSTALAHAQPEDLVLITGSFYLVGLWQA